MKNLFKTFLIGTVLVESAKSGNSTFPGCSNSTAIQWCIDQNGGVPGNFTACFEKEDCCPDSTGVSPTGWVNCTDPTPPPTTPPPTTPPPTTTPVAESKKNVPDYAWFLIANSGALVVSGISQKVAYHNGASNAAKSFLWGLVGMFTAGTAGAGIAWGIEKGAALGDHPIVPVLVATGALIGGFFSYKRGAAVTTFRGDLAQPLIGININTGHGQPLIALTSHGDNVLGCRIC